MDYRQDIEMLSGAARKAREQKHPWLHVNGLTCGQAFANHVIGAALKPCMNRQTALEMAMFSYMWSVAGEPRVVVDHRLAASFMATAIPADLCESVRLPWDDFVLSVPSGILARDERWIMVRKAIIKGAYGARIRMSAPYDGSGGDEADLVACAPWIEFAESKPDLPTGTPQRDAAQRILTVSMRLLFSVCVEFDRRSSVGGGGCKAESPRASAEPLTTTVRISRPVKVDVRQALRSYLRGDRSGLTVQLLVRGHWKNQPHGLGATARKFIHIEPYWRGPEEAPIAVRPHILKDPKKKPDGGEGGAPPQAAE